MKYKSLFFLLMISGAVNAGSLGKYQQERVDVPITIAPVGQSMQSSGVSHPRIVKSSGAEDVERSFYVRFDKRVQKLSGKDKQTWLVQYKNSLQVALGESPIDVNKINHYSRLISILQSQQEG